MPHLFKLNLCAFCAPKIVKEMEKKSAFIELCAVFFEANLQTHCYLLLLSIMHFALAIFIE